MTELVREPRSAESDSAGYDVLVIGAGVGGLCAAARLAHAGLRVLVVERETWLGGRAGTIEHDGFLLPQGGIALELGGPMEQLFRSVGATYDVRAPTPSVVVRAGRRRIDTTSPLGRLLIDRVALRAAARLMHLWKPPVDGDAPTLADVVARWTRGADVPRRLARNFAAGSFGLNADEVTAHAAFTFVTQKGAFRRYGFGPRGTGAVLEQLAEVVRRNGGDVWTGSEVLDVDVRDGKARSVTVRRPEEEPQEIGCRAIVSNAGPAATVALLGADALPDPYLAAVRERDVPTPIIVVDVASRHALMEEAGIVFFATTDRVAAIGHLTASATDVAPPGWRLYVVYAVPVPALGPYDEEAEVAATMAELREQLTDFDSARVLRTRVFRDDWPAQRTVAGRELPMQTPLANVVNVGDGVRDYGDGGMQACAVTGSRAADLLLARLITPAR